MLLGGWDEYFARVRTCFSTRFGHDVSLTDRDLQIAGSNPLQFLNNAQVAANGAAREGGRAASSSTNVNGTVNGHLEPRGDGGG